MLQTLILLKCVSCKICNVTVHLHKSVHKVYHHIHSVIREWTIQKYICPKYMPWYFSHRPFLFVFSVNRVAMRYRKLAPYSISSSVLYQCDELLRAKIRVKHSIGSLYSCGSKVRRNTKIFTIHPIHYILVMFYQIQAQFSIFGEYSSFPK